jgi:hypothetical protein
MIIPLVRELARVSGVQVIQRNQDIARPARPFLDVNVENIVASYNLEDYGTDVTGVDRGQRLDITVDIIAYSDSAVGPTSALALLRRTELALKLDTSVDRLAVDNLAVHDVSPVRNVSVVYLSKFEGRATMQIKLYAVDVALDATPNIETVLNLLTYL